MTSKEAVKVLKGYLGIDAQIIIDALIPIAEDLEILDKITKILTDMIEDDSVGCLNYKLEDYLTKIEEWLNDK